MNRLGLNRTFDAVVSLLSVIAIIASLVAMAYL